ncbi:hypothetical protein IMCC12053_622 [Celeribacter marinus]|uniref:Mobile element protein n=1 Tax=Celeribacter marinus TaxID=1397108 RepID=A0A0N9ZMM2_9RHOB|nr:hypothetical protein IMCC12053_622 [Celeribacter marinus]
MSKPASALLERIERKHCTAAPTLKSRSLCVWKAYQFLFLPK